MVWLKIDRIEMEPDEIISSYGDPKKIDIFTPPDYTLKVKIGDTTLSGKLLNNFIVVDDEKLNTVYDQAKELEKVRNEAYERGRKAGYEAGLNWVIDMLENKIDINDPDTSEPGYSERCNHSHEEGPYDE